MKVIMRVMSVMVILICHDCSSVAVECGVYY